MVNKSELIQGYRTFAEMNKCHHRLLKTAVVSQSALDIFKHWFAEGINAAVVHNVVETDNIKRLSKEDIMIQLSHNVINLCSVGRLTEVKSYDRLFQALARLVQLEYNNWHLYLLGKGELQNQLEKLANMLGIHDKITFLGYDINPYKYVAKMDLFVCSSLREGFSTAVTESIIVGTPVLTTRCSGMDEIIGNTNAGIIVDNSTNGLFDGLKQIFAHPECIERMHHEANARAIIFSKEYLIKQFEDFIEE
jgi:glycosyltransferase involved in cell wall biosynthesis